MSLFLLRYVPPLNSALTLSHLARRYGSGDFAVTRLLQNRRFDMAMVAFLECLRRLVEFVTARDPKIRVPHALSPAFPLAADRSVVDRSAC